MVHENTTNLEFLSSLRGKSDAIYEGVRNLVLDWPIFLRGRDAMKDVGSGRSN